MKEWQTGLHYVIIKPFPYIECNMTATAEPISIPMGETRDVTVRIDTGDSFWCLEGEKYYTFTKREFCRHRRGPGNRKG